MYHFNIEKRLPGVGEAFHLIFLFYSRTFFLIFAFAKQLAYILAKVFSYPLWEIRSFNGRRITIAISARAMVLLLAPVLGVTLHIKPSVECYQ